MPEADATEPFVESCQLPAWIVGADSIRPNPQIFDSTWMNAQPTVGIDS